MIRESVEDGNNQNRELVRESVINIVLLGTAILCVLTVAYTRGVFVPPRLW